MNNNNNNNKLVSYSSILKTSFDFLENEKIELEKIRLEKEKELLQNIDKVYISDINILPIYNNVYNRKNTIKWLCKKFDINLYNYDYCVILFDLMMKHINNKNYFIRVPEHILFTKFLSIMFLLSYNSIC